MEKETAETFSVTLNGNDALMLQVSGQSIEVRQARGRNARQKMDECATKALSTGLELLAVWIPTTIHPMQGLNQQAT